MTIVCCWLDQSLSRSRISAVADGRAATKDGDQWKPITDTTTKLFRVPVGCYELQNLNFQTGAWSNPYYTKEIGLGFAGHCFEALSIVNFFMRAASQLVAVESGSQRPHPENLCAMLVEIADNWFASYSDPKGVHVEFLLFGYSPIDGEPWAGKIVRPKGKLAALTEWEAIMRPESVFGIGDIGQARSFTDNVADIRKRVLKKVNALNTVELERMGIEPDLESAKLQNADRMVVEDLIGNEVMDEAKATVGGVMQKIEVYPTSNYQGVVSFSRDDAPFELDRLSEVAPGLAYMGVSFAMGDKGRPSVMSTTCSG